MKIDVALNPAEIALLPQRDLSQTTCVVFDILRATSSMITALAHGATELHPVRTIEEALALKARIPSALLGGERWGDRINGFDLGNSPLEYLDEVAGRAIITTTTNGTIALRACEHARDLLVGALLNMGTLVQRLRGTSPTHLLLVCAGTFETFALEDAFAAGVLIRELRAGDATAELSDSAHAAVAIATSRDDPVRFLQQTQNGRVLMKKGRRAEVEWCAQQSRYNIVGFMETAVIRSLR